MKRLVRTSNEILGVSGTIRSQIVSRIRERLSSELEGKFKLADIDCYDDYFYCKVIYYIPGVKDEFVNKSISIEWDDNNSSDTIDMIDIEVDAVVEYFNTKSGEISARYDKYAKINPRTEKAIEDRFRLHKTFKEEDEAVDAAINILSKFNFEVDISSRKEREELDKGIEPSSYEQRINYDVYHNDKLVNGGLQVKRCFRDKEMPSLSWAVNGAPFNYYLIQMYMFDKAYR